MEGAVTIRSDSGLRPTGLSTEVVGSAAIRVGCAALEGQVIFPDFSQPRPGSSPAEFSAVANFGVVSLGKKLIVGGSAGSGGRVEDIEAYGISAVIAATIGARYTWGSANSEQ